MMFSQPFVAAVHFVFYPVPTSPNGVGRMGISSGLPIFARSSTTTSSHFVCPGGWVRPVLFPRARLWLGPRAAWFHTWSCLRPCSEP
jgi:hypothetical protein